MKLINLKRVDDYNVEKWLENSIPDLTEHQKQCIENDEIIRFAPFYFMEKRKKTSNVFLRFTIIFMLPVIILLILGLPFNYFITGRWGYNDKMLKWYSNWTSSCGL
jgi:hypothetical protein